MVTFALFILFFSIESKDERDSAFSLDTFSDKTFVITSSGSLILLVLSTVLGIFQVVMKTVSLDVRQWLICIVVALSIVVVAEIRKAVLRQTARRTPQSGRSMAPAGLNDHQQIALAVLEPGRAVVAHQGDAGPYRSRGSQTPRTARPAASGRALQTRCQRR